MRRRRYLQGGLLMILVAGPAAAQTWHATNPGQFKLQVAPSTACSNTWYDPEVLVNANGDIGFYAQGGNVTPCTTGGPSPNGVDSIYRSLRTVLSGGTKPQWVTPAQNACPNIVGTYLTGSCPAPFVTEPLASPDVVKVGNKYFMAFVGGNSDLIKGHIFWAVSNDGLTWTVFKWDPKPPGFAWRPLVFPKFGDNCQKLGISQLQLVYDPSTAVGPEGTFYILFSYEHRTAGGHRDSHAFRFNYSSANGFGIGGGQQICQSAVEYGPCTWLNHTGKLVWSYDGQPAEPGDPLLFVFRGMNRLAWGGADVVWNPLQSNWLRLASTFNNQIVWQTSPTLANANWTIPQAVDLSSFNAMMTTRYPLFATNIKYAPGLWYGQLGPRTGMWGFVPVSLDGCTEPFTGLSIVFAELNYN